MHDDFDEPDYWQEYKDDQLMGPPREEPDEPDEPEPLDLDAIQARLDRLKFLGPFGNLKTTRVELTGEEDLAALRDLIGDDVPRLIAELQAAEAELERVHAYWDSCTHVYEYVLTRPDATPDDGGAAHVTAQQADNAVDHPERFKPWARTTSTSPWAPHQAPPF